MRDWDLGLVLTINPQLLIPYLSIFLSCDTILNLKKCENLYYTIHVL